MKILNKDWVKILDSSVLQYYRHHQHRCTKILKTSNIEELRRGLVKTLRGLSIAVSDDCLSAELLIPSTLPQANYVLLIFFLISIIIINHLTSFSHSHNILLIIIIITITIALFHQSVSNLDLDISIY